ncbi:diaminopropionate ammonia-lyase [Treponema primitia]|uniref:diaminopropionate ammonia-lyase n=1 Tax=Treponema primitia TaxID=88058 RepID=UPI00025558AC|nr:diaminopropionate ammonia-lyase [Treponema primitia]
MRDPALLGINWVKNDMPKSDCQKSLALMSGAEAEKALAFHRSIPHYAETPLVNLKNLAARLGIKGLYLKDESYRFGLNAFKVLGGSYAIARHVAGELIKIGALNAGQGIDYETLVSPDTKKKLGDSTFYTATDGNHGRGVAWAANRLGQKSVILMPKGSSQTRLRNILNEGADASITELNYDDAVRLANDMASKDPRGVMVQDTAWAGYEEIPGWIMQGYGTMTLEAIHQLSAAGIERPTHVFVQAGVGSLAGSVQGFLTNHYADKAPVTTVVEASAADCLYRSAKEHKLVPVGGELKTIMAGLACGEANTISWEILKNHSSFFVSVPDWVAARGMRVLGAPLKGDPQVISGESGAAPAGLLSAVLDTSNYAALGDALGLNKDSVVLLFSTEGDTDPDRYRSIVWDGEFAGI